ncbi:hypothetical protein K458DRAFT_413641 [Lentithecium fluviatile CBS 122367]|uniref:Uncharacterized protein n=1 Tax=Lentithecium fluviatile CBS 122367 TaxID=1168545 RepID=A0A6G1JFJ9_9PLEO|nr:hypothetical protein K458DRAFT_413641 [Lentithecium fluviatile CBS 122367]
MSCFSRKPWHFLLADQIAMLLFVFGTICSYALVAKWGQDDLWCTSRGLNDPVLGWTPVIDYYDMQTCQLRSVRTNQLISRQ